jgi:hypothetical protein
VSISTDMINMERLVNDKIIDGLLSSERKMLCSYISDVTVTESTNIIRNVRYYEAIPILNLNKTLTSPELTTNDLRVKSENFSESIVISWENHINKYAK